MAANDPVLFEYAADARSQLKPPLKWAGGKRWLVPHLAAYWGPHRHRRLVEPFCGGLSVALGLMPGSALLNDINPHVINFYQWLRTGLRVSVPLANDEQVYYENRDRFNELAASHGACTSEAAGLFYYLNRTGFNGLCRFNRSGKFNVPFGKYKKINYASDFAEYKDALADWEFRAGDFGGLELRADDWVYADPPYDVEFTTYSKEGFDWEDQVRLARWLAGHSGPVLLSNQATPRIKELYTELGFELILLQGPRRISCNGDRTPAEEVLALKGV